MDRVQPDDPIMEDEVFGPVMPILTYRDLDPLLERIKKNPAPLVFYVFTRNIRKAKRILMEIPSGGGMINDVVLLFINMNTPFGGVGESGIGSYHGEAGFRAFSHDKTILNKPTWFELFLKYPPYRDFNMRILRSVLGKRLRNFWH
jgi:aldehyde dehydrogenase (NAD+)